MFNLFSYLNTGNWWAVPLTVLLLSTSSAYSAQPVEPAFKPVFTSLRLTDETYKLPNNERMGMTSATLLFDISKNWRVGAATYAATRGSRGGFITLGSTAEWHQPLFGKWGTQAGLFVGAGGGRNGAAVAGGGLMLRGDIGLTYNLSSWGRMGFGVSHVNFPSGVISTTQPYVMLEHNFYTPLADAWLPESNAALKLLPNLNIREHEVGPNYRRYLVPSSVVQDDGQKQHPSIDLMGFLWQGYIDDNWFMKIEAEGAMGGKSDGYMQLFGGGGYRWNLSPGTDFKLYGSLGAGGGGRVDTGGGFMIDAGFALRQQLHNNFGIELSLAGVAAPSRSFKATSVGVQLSYRFGLPHLADGGLLNDKDVLGLDPEHMRIRFAEQTYFDTSTNWRNSNQDLKVSNLGMQMDYFFTPRWFLTGQGLAAYSGKAGSYMKGLVGIGGRIPLSQSLFAEGEALMGAAGGGGLRVGGGFVTQANLSLGYHLNKSFSVMATLGQFDAVKGDMKAKVAGVSLAYQLSILTAP